MQDIVKLAAMASKSALSPVHAGDALVGGFRRGSFAHGGAGGSLQNVWSVRFEVWHGTVVMTAQPAIVRALQGKSRPGLLSVRCICTRKICLRGQK